MTEPCQRKRALVNGSVMLVSAHMSSIITLSVISCCTVCVAKATQSVTRTTRTATPLAVSVSSALIMASTNSTTSLTPSIATHVQRIILLGGSGTAGAHIARAFLLPEYAPRVQLSILSRKETATIAGPKQAALDGFVKQGAKMVHGDLSKSTDAELVQLFSGQDVVVSAVGSEQLSAQTRYISAAKLAGVKWFVPSEFGGDSKAVGRGSLVSLYDTKIEVQAALKASGLAYTIVNSGAFSEYILSPFLGLDLVNGTLTAQGGPQVSFNTTPLAEVGRQTADAIVSGRGRNATIFLGDRITFQQLGDIVEKAIGKQLTRKVRTQAEAEEAVAANPGDYAARFSAIFAASRGTGWPANQTYAAQNGLQVQTFEAFAQKTLTSGRE